MKMNNVVKIFFLLVIIVIFGCKKDKLNNKPTPTNLVIDIQSETANPPSTVSIFFRVKDTKGNPISGLSEDNFIIKEQGRNDEKPRVISADEAQRVISDNETVFKYNVILLLDLSGSVLNNNLDKLKEASIQFVDKILGENRNTSTKIGIFWFDGLDLLHPLVDFTSNSELLVNGINEINSEISTDNSTDLFGAIIKGSRLAANKIDESVLQGFQSSSSVIVFTDGSDQAGRYGKNTAYKTIDSLNTNINYYSIGLGSEIDKTVLSKIGKDFSVIAEDKNKLNEKFQDIAELIFNESNSFYLFEYCTPKRDGSGDNKLRIEVFHEGKSGNTTTSFNASGFKSGCSL